MATTTVARRAAQPLQASDAEQGHIQEHRQVQTQRRSILAAVAARFEMDPDGFARTLRATVFKGANNEEFAALLVVTKEYGLNPLTKEIYAFPQKGGGIVPLVSVDGWIRIMNEHPQFDGIEFTDIVDENGNLYAIESVIYRKDRSRPIKVTEYLDECKRNTDPWNKSPKRMLRHRALQQGARIAFGFSGIHSEDDEIVGEIALGGDLSRAGPAPMRQAQPALVHQQDDESYDPETGELDEETARDLDRQAFAQQDGRLDDDPRQGEADALIDRCEGAEVLGDVIAVEADLQKAGLPDDLAESVQSVANAARARLTNKGGK